MSVGMTLEISPGTSIDRACEDACRVANILGIDVEFTFNEVVCFARPGGSSAHLAQEWEQQLRRKLSGPYDRRFAMTDSKSAHQFLRTHSTTGGA